MIIGTLHGNIEKDEYFSPTSCNLMQYGGSAQKVLNTPLSFGFYSSKEEIRSRSKVYLVEGLLPVILPRLSFHSLLAPRVQNFSLLALGLQKKLYHSGLCWSE